MLLEKVVRVIPETPETLVGLVTRETLGLAGLAVIHRLLTHWEPRAEFCLAVVELVGEGAMAAEVQPLRVIRLMELEALAVQMQ
jgi:hypothetical protein